jgi:glucose-6-phosphate 1-epimerase
MTNDPIVINHSASGACATVYPFGATITSYINAKGHETLFLSKLAKLDGSKATRGGIPLVFPQFGQPNRDMPQHGFLRNNYWIAGECYDNGEEAGCDLTLSLKDVVNGRGDGFWKDGESGVDCSAILSIKITAASLTTIMTIQNTGSNAFDYQTLFHTYYKIHGSTALDHKYCNITGLSGYKLFDQLTKEEWIQGDEPVVVDREVDCIFHPQDGKTTLEVEIQTGNDHSKVTVHSTAAVDGELVPVSAVVWNPFIEKSKKMEDFGDDEYHDMVCVEPGVLGLQKKLYPGKKCSFLQKISTL